MSAAPNHPRLKLACLTNTMRDVAWCSALRKRLDTLTGSERPSVLFSCVCRKTNVSVEANIALLECTLWCFLPAMVPCTCHRGDFQGFAPVQPGYHLLCPWFCHRPPRVLPSVSVRKNNPTPFCLILRSWRFGYILCLVLLHFSAVLIALPTLRKI